MANGFVNWPKHQAPTGNIYEWFKAQINPTYPAWDGKARYKIGDRVSFSNASFEAKSMINAPKALGAGPALPNPSPVGAPTAWTKLIFVPKDVAALGSNWRASTPGGLIATAATEVGSFSHMEYLYRMEYPDNDLYCFSVSDDGSATGQGVHPQEVALLARNSPYNQYLLITDASTIDELKNAKVLGLYHGIVHTQEVTFLTPIPRDKFTGWRLKTGQVGTFTPLP